MDTKSFIASRNFGVPRETLWKAWTDPDHFQEWFGTKGSKGHIKTFDLRPGGILHSCLTMPDGTQIWAKFVYREVEPPSHLQWEHSFADEKGITTRHPLNSNWPLVLISTVNFEARGDQTTLTLNWIPLEASERERATFEHDIPAMGRAWDAAFDQLEAYLVAHFAPAPKTIMDQKK